MREERGVREGDHVADACACNGEQLDVVRMEDAVVAACERNLQVWEMYLDGIGAAGDGLRGR